MSRASLDRVAGRTAARASRNAVPARSKVAHAACARRRAPPRSRATFSTEEVLARAFDDLERPLEELRSLDVRVLLLARDDPRRREYRHASGQRSARWKCSESSSAASSGRSPWCCSMTSATRPWSSRRRLYERPSYAASRMSAWRKRNAPGTSGSRSTNSPSRSHASERGRHGRIVLEHLGDQRSRERDAEHRRPAEQRAVSRSELVDARRDEGLDGVGQVLGVLRLLARRWRARGGRAGSLPPAP